LATSTLISRRRLGGHDPWVNNPKLYQPKALPQVWSYPVWWTVNCFRAHHCAAPAAWSWRHARTVFTSREPA